MVTNEQNRLICERLAGYEVQVSPAGKWYVVTGDETKPIVDYEHDYYETLSTAEALCKSRGLELHITKGGFRYPIVSLGTAKSSRHTITSALAHCLLQIAEGEE